MSVRQKNILLFIFVLTFVFMALTATFAFFTNLNVSSESESQDVTSATMEILVFNPGDAINVYADSYNFSEVMPSLWGKTIPTVTLIAGSEHKKATYYYNVNLEIESNDFEHTLDPSKPEVLLHVVDAEGKEVKNIKNLTYYENIKPDPEEDELVSGFDITGITGDFSVAEKYLIETTESITHEWQFDVIFVNYSDNQDQNRGKELKGKITLEKVDVTV